MPNINTNHAITYTHLLLSLLLSLLLTKINELDSCDTAPLRTYTVLIVYHYQNLTQTQSSLYLYTTYNSLLNCTLVQTVAALKCPLVSTYTQLTTLH